MGVAGKGVGWLGRAGIFAINPGIGTVGAVTEASVRGGRRLKGGIRSAAEGNLDDAGKAALHNSTDPVSKARSFAARRPGATALGVGAMAGPAIYSGGPGSGKRASSMNQNSYYVRRMRSGQASGVAGINPQSLGGFS